MAFRGGRRKEVKKLSYYVWFLGAKESKGLRGEEYIQPVLHYLLEKEKEWEPMKVTLQVSNKGMKIIQNVPRRNAKGKTEQIKHFIPHHAITCVYQDTKPNDDIVCCILLIYNPLTRCPVHVHTYRCDSVETATTLKQHLQILIDRPENQKKFREIENRLAAKGLLPGSSRRVNSDGRSTRTDGSDRTEDSGELESLEASAVKKDNIASLYDSLAQELRERLNNPNSCPILLPPKDYDTISRRRGKLDGIETRRSTNMNLVGLNKLLKPPALTRMTRDLGKESESSGHSSGIGSDEALSSAIQEVSSHPDFEPKEVDPDTSSDDDDWPDPSASAIDISAHHVPTANAEWRLKPSQYKVAPPSSSPPILSTNSLVAVPDPRSKVVPKEAGHVDYYGHSPYEPASSRTGAHRDAAPWPERRSSPGPERALSPSRDRFEASYRSIERELVSYPDSRARDPSPIGKDRRLVDSRESWHDLDRRSASPPSLSQQRKITPPFGRGAAAAYQLAEIPSFNGSRRNQNRMSPDDLEDKMAAAYHKKRSSGGVIHYPRGPRSASPGSCYARSNQCHVARTSSSPEKYATARSNSPDLYCAEKDALGGPYAIAVERQAATYHPEEPPTRRSGYFDLPVDSADYRHGFLESPFRRLPLHSQY